MIKNDELLLSAYRAMLFCIIPKVRFIFIEVEQHKYLKVWIYLDQEINSDEKDIFFSFAGEISGDFPSLDDENSKVNFVVDNNSFQSLNKLQHLIYARFEK